MTSARHWSGAQSGTAHGDGGAASWSLSISSDGARRIVQEMKAVLGQDVNLMDDQGVIVASTDETRVGTLHLGARRLIVERLDRLEISGAEDVPGARPGLNLPLVVDGAVAGVVGVTGPPEAFALSANLIRRMTEIMVREARTGERRDRRRRSLSRFLHEWLRDGHEPSPALVAQGREHGVDIRREQVVAHASITALRESSRGAEAVDAVTESLIREARGMGAVAASGFGQVILLVPCVGAGDRRAARPEEHLAEWLAGFAERVESSDGVRVLAGVSGTGLLGPEAALQAETALRCARAGAGAVLRYEQLALELLLADVPSPARQAFVAKILGPLSGEGGDEARRTLQAYFAADGSLARAAGALHIHKNTLTNRLVRIAAATGYDPRRSADAALLWLALEASR